MKLTWYFDFISPFAYLQHARFGELPVSVTVEYRPILFAGLLNHWQNVGPAEIAPKRIFTYKHCYWKAKQAGIPFNMPPTHPFNSLFALRLAIALNCQPNAIQTLFDVIWKHGLALDSSDAHDYLQKNLAQSNLDELASDPAVKAQLRKNTEQAAKDGVFGVPSFVTEGTSSQLFWGLDAFDMLLDYLQDPKGFYDAQMQRLETLPVGVQRQRN